MDNKILTVTTHMILAVILITVVSFTGGYIAGINSTNVALDALEKRLTFVEKEQLRRTELVYKRKYPK